MNAHLGPQEYLQKLRQTEEMVEIEPDEESIRQLFRDNPFMRELMLDIHKNRDGVHYCVAIFDELVSELSAPLQNRIRSQVAIGEMQWIGVNATLRKAVSPYEGYVIVINQGLASFFFMLTNLALKRAATLPYLKGFELEIRPSMEFAQVAALVKRLLALYHEGKLPMLPVQEISDRDERVYLLASLQWYVIMFVVAHELGHFLNQRGISGNPYDQEFDADETGFTLLLNSAYGKRDDLELRKAIAGAGLALHYIEMLEASHGRISSTHPPAEKRIARLREKFQFPEVCYEILGPMESLLGEIKQAVLINK